MCTNKTLYRPGDVQVSVPKRRGRKSRFSFQQVSFMTDCLRMLANRLEMPIVEVSELLSRKAIYVYFVQMVTGQPELSRVQVTNRLQKALAAA